MSLPRYVRTVWLGRCPSCGQTSMFRGFSDLVEQCGVCGLRYDDGDGSSMGAIQLGYVFGVKVALIAIAVELIWAPLSATPFDPTWAIAAIGGAATVAGYRPSKALWVLLLYRFGWLHWGDGRASDEPREAPRSTRLAS